MADKEAEFRSNVGQAVMGDVNEAPRIDNRNVLHLNLGGEESKQQFITDLQRKMIARKVKELIAQSDLKQLDIYGVILTELGAKTISELPLDRYKDAMALLDGWIAESAGGTPSQSSTPETPTTVAPQHTEPRPCDACAYHQRQTKQARFMMILQTAVMVLGTAAFTWMLWKNPAAATHPIETRCQLEGKSYSVGGIVRMMNGAFRECTQDADSSTPYWDAPQKNGAPRHLSK